MGNFTARTKGATFYLDEDEMAANLARSIAGRTPTTKPDA